MPMSTGLVLVASRAFVLSAEAAWLQDPKELCFGCVGDGEVESASSLKRGTVA